MAASLARRTSNMALPSFSLDTPPFDSLKKLPAELCIQIMHSCNSLEDIQSFIAASPKALSCFRENRHGVLRPYVADIEKEFYDSDLIPLALTMVKLRSIRCQTSYIGPLQVQQQIQPIVKSILDSAYTNMHQRWRENLPSLVTLTNLLPEIQDAIRAFVMQISWVWAKRINDGPKLLHWKSPRPPSRTSGRKFLEAWLRHQSYLSIYHSSEDVRYCYADINGRYCTVLSGIKTGGSEAKLVDGRYFISDEEIMAMARNVSWILPLEN
ncbi:hypothetical protein NW762_014497 [Fusarium torreyae]|uniref:Uncharacterized protein n=1 Tax=Fusarium torreyae TaxID=1237075 RepID=A0A9W8RLH7_9HYPO|nr:hypothetical protein NW762_014497 [Fusarium torreyae]